VYPGKLHEEKTLQSPLEGRKEALGSESFKSTKTYDFYREADVKKNLHAISLGCGAPGVCRGLVFGNKF